MYQRKHHRGALEIATMRYGFGFVHHSNLMTSISIKSQHQCQFVLLNEMFTTYRVMKNYGKWNSISGRSLSL